ncbi:MAG: acyltransferase family protein [Allosphingosinicella sp.]
MDTQPERAPLRKASAEGEALATSDPTPKSHPLVALDVMRSVAAFMVVLAHARGTAFPTYGTLPADQQGLPLQLFYAISRLGMEAVLVFFVLSGYLVGGQIVRRLRDGRFDLGSYAIDRVTRIMLPLLPAVVFTAAAGMLFAGYQLDPVQVLGHFVGLNEVVVPTLSYNGPLWTLAYEIWFYIIAGALGACLAYRRVSALFVLIAGLAIFFVLDARLLLIWMLGAVLVLFREPSRPALLAALGAVLTVTGVALYQLEQASVSVQAVTMLPPGMSRLVLATGIAFTLPYLTLPRVNAFLAPIHRPFLFLSAMSYSLYLFHRPLMLVFTSLFAPGYSFEQMQSGAITGTHVAVFAGLLATSLIGAFGFWLLFERHTDRARRALRRRIGGSRVASAVV